MERSLQLAPQGLWCPELCLEEGAVAWLLLDLREDYFLLCHSHSCLSKRKSSIIPNVISEETEAQGAQKVGRCKSTDNTGEMLLVRVLHMVLLERYVLPNHLPDAALRH